MPIVTFQPSLKKSEVPVGTTILEACEMAGIPLASACSSSWVCGRCIVQVTQGMENLSLITPNEQKLLSRDHRKPGERIGCMAHVEGDCSITTTYW